MSRLNKWGARPAKSTNPATRAAFFCGVLAADRDECMEKARYALNPGDRVRWVQRARFNHHQMLKYIHLLGGV